MIVIIVGKYFATLLDNVEGLASRPKIIAAAAAITESCLAKRSYER